ncbi:MAG: twin-arginine translocase TatA/TatE family subunit [Muribaculaceae bacterium]|jgi:sec-independent protein translocase protein TatA|nr:twin-arginine translocase TatA/TatE family subunit [Muribaculaceae bacterium]MBQ2440173.1 twin-arginine translocase TatA/TatE family subunit [Muribaculaceae bacterium]MBQ5724143.1 twin-arginine translocase TatA/TatE family subunit [Muribaculaceae bacterium]
MTTLLTILGLLGLGTQELIIIALIVLLLFGARKIPELMRSVGKGIRYFKEGMKDAGDEINKDSDESARK